jgi:hypothetical protein
MQDMYAVHCESAEHAAAMAPVDGSHSRPAPRYMFKQVLQAVLATSGGELQ